MLILVEAKSAAAAKVAHKVFVKHRPNRFATAVRIPATHSEELVKHLGKSGLSAKVGPKSGSAKYHTVVVSHDAAHIPWGGKTRTPTAGARLNSIHSRVAGAVSRTLGDARHLVLHNLRSATGGKVECVDPVVFDLVERLDALVDGEPLVEGFSSDQVQAALAHYGNVLKGGKGDKLDPSKFPREVIEFGLKVEREHTDDVNKALEIVMDHLAEKPDYYKRLDAAGLVDESIPASAWND